MYNIPILILTYNRPRHLFKLLLKLKKINPKKIYISCDGPKNELDKKKIFEIKKQIKLINKKTKVILNFFKVNHGIRLSPQKGISWFFKKEKLGIILEDDCVPNIFFFSYMKFLLLKYKNNKKIYAISGYSHFKKNQFEKGIYFFSNYFFCWGWATWKRSWNSSLKNFSSDLNKNEFYLVQKKFTNQIEIDYWKKNILYIKKNIIKTWDVQFMYSMWKKKSYCILPNFNMINNIGFDEYSTTSPGLKFKVAKTFNGAPKFKNQKKIEIISSNERKIFENFFNPKNFLYPWRILYLIRLLVSQPRYFFKKIITVLKSVL